MAVHRVCAEPPEAIHWDAERHDRHGRQGVRHRLSRDCRDWDRSALRNADGVGTFTAPNQPYFNYNQIVAPNGYTGNKLWKFNVPSTVTAVSMSILISTDFPAEQNVAISPPASVPDGVLADTAVSPATDSVHLPFVRRILQVRFRTSATLADRQLAIAYVNGKVIGGQLDGIGGDGYYYVQIVDDGSGGQLFHASVRLGALPQVEMAVMQLVMGPNWLKPTHDSGDWAHWTLSPDSARTDDQNWAPLMINSPFAWGCNVGDNNAMVGIVDHGFRQPDDLKANLPMTSYAFNPPDTGDHATNIASIIAAKGDSGGGMTGIMWRAALKIEDPRRDTLGSGKQVALAADATAIRIARLAQLGVRIVNVSSGAPWKDGYTPHDSTDTLLVRQVVRSFLAGLRFARIRGYTAPLPLIVFSAGNFPLNIDSWWSGYPQLRDSLGDSVLVVGASTKNRTIASFSGANVTHA